MSVTRVVAGQRPSSSDLPGSRGALLPRQRLPVLLQHQGQHGAQLGHSEAQKRILDLEKSLQFLQQQHSETLVMLHEEIDHLKRENQDLHYKLIMNQKPQKRGSIASSGFQSKSMSNSAVSANSQGKARPQLISKKQDLKADIAQKMELEEKPPLHSSKLDKAPRAQGLSKDEEENFSPEATSVTGNQHKGKQVRGAAPPMSLPPHLRKPTSLQQCEAVIRQLWNANLLQAQELQRLRSLLEGTQEPSNTAPEEAGPHSNHAQARLRCPPSAPTSLVPSPMPMPVAEHTTLPALKQSQKSNFLERQKRLQVVRRQRLHRSGL